MPIHTGVITRFGRLTGAALVLVLAGSPRAAEPPRATTYTIAVVPNQPALVLDRVWTPFVERLAKDSGVALQLKLYERLATFQEDCAEGRPDLIYSAPNMFFEAHRAQRYAAFVRGRRMLSGVVFVRRDSPLRSLADLDGKTIAFVGPKNLCAVISRHAVSTSGVAIKYNATFSGSTVNVAKMVAMGKADAGATLDESLVRDAPELTAELRTLLQTPPFASHPIAAHPRVPQEVRERIVSAALALAGSEEGRRLLAGVKLADPVRAETRVDYGAFDAIDLAPLRTQGH
jgi:phosphonate transport system substrate-binding protein